MDSESKCFMQVRWWWWWWWSTKNRAIVSIYKRIEYWIFIDSLKSLSIESKWLLWQQPLCTMMNWTCAKRITRKKRGSSVVGHFSCAIFLSSIITFDITKKNYVKLYHFILPIHNLLLWKKTDTFRIQFISTSSIDYVH